LSDSDADTVQTYEYSVYGQVAASTNFLTNPYMFTGRRFDIENGLYYYRARYYNPHIGRFMQTDSVGYSAGMNLYRYCGNNPLVFVDPSGYYPISISIPLNTVWDNPSTDQYLAENPEHSHMKDVDPYLRDAGFYDLYPDVTLTSVDYRDGYYECEFDVPNDLDIKMNKVTIQGVTVLNVTNSEGVNTPIIDKRLAIMIGEAVDKNSNWLDWKGWSWVGGGMVAGGGIMIKVGAGTSWSPVGWVIGGTGLVIVVADTLGHFIAVHLKDTSKYPNIEEIEEALRRAIEETEVEDPYI
jgi:RHS repeat-associated protein